MTETVLHMLGHVGTDVDHRKVGAGIDLSTFRLASTPRKWDKAQRGYVDGATNWITVQCWRSLAVHVRDSVRRGDPVIVVGRLRTEEWTRDDVRNSRFVLEATAVGHDLGRGTSRFVKAARVAEPAPDETAGVVAALEDVEREQQVESPPDGPPGIAPERSSPPLADAPVDPGVTGAEQPGVARDSAAAAQPDQGGAEGPQGVAAPDGTTAPDGSQARDERTGDEEKGQQETRPHRGWRRAS